MSIYRSYCSFYFPRPIIHLDYSFHLIFSLQYCLSWWLFPGDLPYYLLNNCLCVCGLTCAHVTSNIPLDPVLRHICSSLFMTFLQMFKVFSPCFLFHAGSGFQWWMLESCWILSIFI